MVKDKKEKTDARFKDFGIVSFTSITKVNDFVDYLKLGKVMGSYCEECDTYYFPPRNSCYKCFKNAKMKWFLVKGKGEIVAFTELRYAPMGFEKEVPYVLAVLDYGKYKIFGRISSKLVFDKLHIGQKMIVKSNRFSNGQWGYVFDLE